VATNKQEARRKIMEKNEKITQRTIVSFVLDESGSMHNVRIDTVDGLNDYIKELKTDPSKTLLRLQTFNSAGFRVAYDFADISEVKEMDYSHYRPGGLTPLLDSVARSIRETEEYVENFSGDNSQVIVTVMTDGLENCSQEYSYEVVKDMIDAKKKLGWVFTYLGANHDVWSVASKMGINREDTRKYDSQNPKGAFAHSARRAMNIKERWRFIQKSRLNVAPCPVCEVGKISKRRGRLFECSNSLKCNFATHMQPMSEPICPGCGGMVFLRGDLDIFCEAPKCGYSGPLT